jgi:two-component system nitrogen regulation response regulator GlnG
MTQQDVRIAMDQSTSPTSGLSSTVEHHLRAYFAAHERQLPTAGLYSRVLQEIERPLLAVTLAECRGNQLKAAELLGLNRNTLRKKIRELGLSAGRSSKRNGQSS